jgi:Flp pilus assembly pilin Flp
MKQRPRFRNLEMFKQALWRALREESGQDLVEYSLLLVLIGTASIAVVDRFGDVVYYTFLRITRWITTQGIDPY